MGDKVDEQLDDEGIGTADTIASDAAGTADTFISAGGRTAEIALSDDSAPVSFEQPGRYRLGTGRDSVELGRGGMGRVLVAVDAHLGRKIAIKELLAGPTIGPGASPESDGHESLARFLREARVTAQLEHPNIVPIYELGKRSDGTVYYAMKLVRGRTMFEALKQAHELGDRLRLLGHFAGVCHAIAYAHSRGVVHRDLKPQNVMLGEFGETIVLDWGLAKVRGKKDIRGKDLEKEVKVFRDAEGFHTVEGSAFGTPAYMSPEQAAGKIDEVDERSDVWSLGVVLYQILTGKLPFAGNNPMALIVNVLEGEMTPVLDACPEAPPELAAIAERALRRNKAERYQNAKELVEDVEAFQSGERVEAHRYSRWQLIAKYLETHRLQVSIGLVAFVSLIVIAFVWQKSAAERAERDQAIKAEAKTNQVLASALTEIARARASARDWMGAELYAAEAVARNPDPEGLGLLVRVAGSWRPRLIWEATAFPSGCLRLALSPDGATIACPMTADIAFWATETGAERSWLRARGGWVLGIAFSPDGRAIAWGGDDGKARIWAAAADALIAEHLIGEGAVDAVAFGKDSRTFAAGAEDGRVRIFGGDRLEPLLDLPSENTAIGALVFSPDGRALVSGSADGEVRVYDAGRGKLQHRLRGHEGPISALAFAPEGTAIASASHDRTVRVWDPAKGTESARLVGHEDIVHAVAFSSDGKRIFTSSADGTVRVWSRSSGEVIAMISAHEGGARGLAISADGRLMVTSGADKTLRAWDLAATEKRPALFHRLPAVVNCLAWQGDDVVTGLADGEIRINSLERGAQAKKFGAVKPAVMAIAVSPDGKTIAAAGKDSEVRLFSGGTEVLLSGHRAAVNSLVFGDKGATLYSAGDDQTVRAFDVASGKQVFELVDEREPCGAVYAISLSPSTGKLAAACEDERVRIWDLAAKTVVDRIAGRGRQIHALSFSPDGRLIALAGSDGAVHVHDFDAKRVVARLSSGEGAVTTVAYSPDGEWIASGGADRMVRVFEAASGAELVRIAGHGDVISEVAFSADGMRLASGSADRTLRVWMLDALRLSGTELTRRTSKNLGLVLSGVKARAASGRGR